MKIFGIGPNKTGTVSIEEACKRLGLRVLHDRKIGERICDALKTKRTDLVDPVLAELDEYDVFLDGPYHEVIDEIREFAFDPRFLGLTRDIDDWINSRIVHCLHNRVLNTGQWKEIHTKAWRREFREIGELITNTLKTEDRMIWMDVAAGDGWEPLCKLLDCKVPQMPFPHFHTAPEKLLQIHSAKSTRRSVGLAPIILGQRSSMNWLSQSDVQLAGWGEDWPDRLGWWDAVFEMPFRLYRHHLQMIAKKNWARIVGLDSIVSLYKWSPELFHDAIIIPIDDDDWLDPQVCYKIRDAIGWNQKTTAVSWSSERIECAGRYTMNRLGKKDWFITNGYALTPAYRDQCGNVQFRDSLSWHFKAAGHTHGMSRHIDKTLGVAPYSWASVSKLKQYENAQQLREQAQNAAKWHPSVIAHQCSETGSTYEREFQELYQLNEMLLSGIK